MLNLRLRQLGGFQTLKILILCLWNNNEIGENGQISHSQTGNGIMKAVFYLFSLVLHTAGFCGGTTQRWAGSLLSWHFHTFECDFLWFWCCHHVNIVPNFYSICNCVVLMSSACKSPPVLLKCDFYLDILFLIPLIQKEYSLRGLYFTVLEP